MQFEGGRNGGGWFAGEFIRVFQGGKRRDEATLIIKTNGDAPRGSAPPIRALPHHRVEVCLTVRPSETAGSAKKHDADTSCSTSRVDSV